MKKKVVASTCISLAVVLSGIALLTGCAARRPYWGDRETGLIMQYRMPENQKLRYKSTNGMTQTMKMMGQDTETRMSTDIVYTLASKGLRDDIYQISTTIDSMCMTVKNPQLTIEPDLTPVIGKSFDMSLSLLGEEKNMGEAQQIKYSMGPQGERSIAGNFQNLYPNLPGKPVRTGESWTTTDTVKINEGGTDIRLLLTSVNTLAGFEEVDGHECARITAAVGGTMDGTGQQGPAGLVFKGDIQSQETWYFAYKKGLLVKMTADGVTKADIAVTGPMEMTIPMTMSVKTGLQLLK